MQPRRRLFVWLVPALWALATVAGFQHPGDEYGLFALGAMAGLWVLLVLEPSSPLGGLAPVLVAGALTTGLLGLLLDRLRASPWVWGVVCAVAAAAAACTMLARFPSLERAIGKNGSLTAYWICAFQLGGYAATLIALAVAAVRGLGAPAPAVQRLL